MYQSKVTVRSIKIVASENHVTDISSIFISLNIRESIDIPTINGDITIQDDMGVYTFLPIIGQELILIEFENDDDITSIVTGFVYKISYFKKESTKRSQYVLHFSSYEQFINQSKRIRRSFKSMTPSDIITDILRSDIKTTKKIIIEKTNGDINYIAPNVTPFQAIKQLLRMSVSVNQDNSNYVFFENRYAYIISPLSSLLHQKPMFNYIYGDRIEDDTSMSPFKIEEFESFKHTDTLDANTKGMFASQLHTVDLISRNIQTYDYDYLSEFNKMDHLNSIPLYKSLSDTSDSSQGNQYFNYVDNGMVEGNEKNDYVKSFDSNMLTVESSKTRLRSIIQNSMMDAYVYRIQIPGNIFIVPSTVINVELPSNDTEGVDPILSGNVLVTSVNHLITGDGSYNQTIETIKDSHIGDTGG